MGGSAGGWAICFLNVLTTTTRRRWRNRNGGVKTAAWWTFRRRSTLHHTVKNKRVTVQGPVKKPPMDYMSHKGWGGWHKASVSDCLPLAAPIGLLPLLIVTLCEPERVLVVSTEPLNDLSCLTTPASAVPETCCCPCR